MIYTFGDYELDTSRYELRLRGKPLRIEPKVFDLLVYLTQHHGQLVTKEDLYEYLWPNQFVSESALTYCITAARKAVGDNGRAQRIIKTVYGRGYRFMAPVAERVQSEPGVDEPTTVEMPPHGTEPTLNTADIILPVIPAQTEPPSVLSAEGPPAARLASSGQSPSAAERRQLTVMCVRMVVTPVSRQRLDPEDLHEVMQDAYHVYSGMIQQFEGHIGQHFGDELIVYFGYPQAHEDDAYRAVRTGLDMVQAVGRLNERSEQVRGVTLAVRVGIHTGLVVMEDVGSGLQRRQMVLGDASQIAARLPDLAAANTVVISSATLRLVEGYFVSRGLGTYDLEALSQSLVAYQVLQESDARHRLAVAMTIGLTPLVAREQEIGLLLERWEHVKEGMGQVVLLSGEAGIGKSRLLQAFQTHMAVEARTRIECRSSPYHQNSALFPIADYIQQRLQWSRNTPPSEKLSKLERILEPYGLLLEEAMPLLAALFSLPLPAHYAALSLTPQQQKQKTLDVLLTWFLKEAEQQPVYLIMEDLHWADPSTLAFLRLLIEQIPTVRMLMLLTFRPDFHTPWAGRSHITHIALSRLTRRQAETMIRSITGEKPLPAEVLRHLVAKSDGVPLFVEEMTRMVVESGLIKEKDNAYELVEPFLDLAIPATLHDLLMARLDRLGTAKQVVQLGATLGREFSYELLQAVAAMDETTLQQGLARAVDAELLHQLRLPPQTRYIFRHVLIQEAAYQSLLRRTKRLYHRRVAQALEQHFLETRETQPELLAHHYTGARLHRQAISYWQQAAQNAMARSAHLEAIAHLRHGIALCPSLPETPERLQLELSLQTALGVALASTQGFAAADVELAYERARELCQHVGNTPQAFAVLRGLWLVHLVRGDLHTAHELGQQLLRLAQDTDDATLRLEANRALGSSLLLRGELGPAWAHLQQGMRLYDPERHRALSFHYGQDSGAVYLGYAAWTQWLRGYPDQALHHINAALTLANQLAHPYSQGFALTFAAWLHQWRREPQAVLARVNASMALAQEHEFPLLFAHGLTLRGWVLVEQGQETEGLEQIRRGLTAYTTTGTGLGQAYLLTLLAEALSKTGRIEESLATLANALAWVERNAEHWWEAEIYRLQGEVLLQQHGVQAAQAEAFFSRALEVARRQQARSLELRAAMSLCRLWQQPDTSANGRRLLAEVYAWFTEGFDTADLVEAAALCAALR